MKQETKDTEIKLVQSLPDGIWVVRWDFKPIIDENGNVTEINSYEEEQFTWIPSLEDIQKVIIEWFNKQTDALIKYGFDWENTKVYLSDENKFNYKAITDEAARRESAIKQWDLDNPDIKGLELVEVMDAEGSTTFVPTGRPKSLLPITLKLGETNSPENFKVFATLDELLNFFSAGVDHLVNAYAAGWYKIATFDWTPYVEAINNLNIN